MSDNVILDKDKLILIYYIGFENNVPIEYVHNSINESYKYFYTYFDESVMVLVVPTFGGRSNKVEYINRDKCTSKEISRVDTLIKRYEKMLEKQPKKVNKIVINS